MAPSTAENVDPPLDELTTGSATRRRGVGRGSVFPNDSLRQFPRFLLVGVANTILSFISYRLLLALGTPYVVAALISFAIGALNGYVFNRRWTFAARDSTRARVLYVTVQAAAAVMMSLLVVAFVRIGGMGHVAAYLAAIPFVTVCSFAANRFWAFVDRD